MTAPENPERIMAVALRLSATGRPEMSASTVPLDWWQKELRGRLSTYVREDVAAREKVAAVYLEKSEETKRADLLAADLLEARATRRAALDETAALRREREALRLIVDEMRAAALNLALHHPMGEDRERAKAVARLAKAAKAAGGTTP